MTLNPPQRDAVHTLRGPLLVLAGAGTGKTRVVTYRVAELIRSGIKAERILAVTFTKKAAAEMRERANKLLNPRRKGTRKRPKDAPRPEISTFHSLCVRMLRRHITRLDYPQSFTICDRSEQESLARAALREIKAPSDTLKPGDLLGMIGRWKMNSIRPHQAVSIAETDREHLAAIGYRRYQQSLKTVGAVDFDDLLLLTEELFTEYPSVRRDEAARFDHVLIDEYQDTNQSQYQIVRGLAMGHRNLCVVGDDDQSIYAWRGAEVTHILRFHKDWPDAKIVRLEDNYRSTEAILHYANTLIVFNRTRHKKMLKASRRGGNKPRVFQCKDETEEAEKVVADICGRLAAGGWELGPMSPEAIAKRKKRPTLQPKDIAILFRTNEQPRIFETALRQANVPYVLIGGMSFFDRREVRDILAYLRVLQNPSDEPALRRILNQPPRGISDVARKRLADAAIASGKSLWDFLGEASGVEGISPKAAAAIGQFRSMMQGLRASSEKQPVVDLIRDVIDRIRYHSELTRTYPNPDERATRTAALEEIVNAASRFDEKGGKRKKSKQAEGVSQLTAFLDDLLLSEREEDDDKDSQLAKNAVALMTLHSAKGLEFPHVYLVGLEEGFLPHKRSLAEGGDDIDEERRLCYVGVTRAKDMLTLSFALTRRKWGKPRDTMPSRFLFEMTGQADNPRSPANQLKGPKGRKPGKPSRTKRPSSQKRPHR